MSGLTYKHNWSRSISHWSHWTNEHHLFIGGHFVAVVCRKVMRSAEDSKGYHYLWSACTQFSFLCASSSAPPSAQSIHCYKDTPLTHSHALVTDCVLTYCSLVWELGMSPTLTRSSLYLEACHHCLSSVSFRTLSTSPVLNCSPTSAQGR